MPSALVLAVEAKAGWTAEARFASSILSAIEGPLPFGRYLRAGRLAAIDGVGREALERSAAEWVGTTFQPVYGFLLGLDDPRDVVDCMNAYNSRELGGEWDQERQDLLSEQGGGEFYDEPDMPPFWALSSGHGNFRLHARRVASSGFDDPRACQIASLSSIEYAVSQAQRRATGAPAADRTLSRMALHFGVEHGAAAEAAWVFERDGGMPIEDLARRLGCGKRTLERELKRVGLTAGKLRLACMMVGATNQLHSGASLTRIAADQDFADLAHMTRAFKESCGMAPSALRKVRVDTDPRKFPQPA